MAIMLLGGCNKNTGPSEPDFSDPRGRQLNSLVDNVIGPANDVLVSRSGELLTAT